MTPSLVVYIALGVCARALKVAILHYIPLSVFPLFTVGKCEVRAFNFVRYLFTFDFVIEIVEFYRHKDVCVK